jgi:hypothetical protein
MRGEVEQYTLHRSDMHIGMFGSLKTSITFLTGYMVRLLMKYDFAFAELDVSR